MGADYWRLLYRIRSLPEEVQRREELSPEDLAAHNAEVGMPEVELPLACRVL